MNVNVSQNNWWVRLVAIRLLTVARSRRRISKKPRLRLAHLFKWLRIKVNALRRIWITMDPDSASPLRRFMELSQKVQFFSDVNEGVRIKRSDDLYSNLTISSNWWVSLLSATFRTCLTVRLSAEFNLAQLNFRSICNELEPNIYRRGPPYNLQKLNDVEYGGVDT